MFDNSFNISNGADNKTTIEFVSLMLKKIQSANDQMSK